MKAFILFIQSTLILFRKIRPNIKQSLLFDAEIFRNVFFEGMKPKNKFYKT